MENRRYKFDKDFLITELKIAKENLEHNISIEEKKQILDMIDCFNKLLGNAEEKDEKKEQTLKIKDMCIRLEEKLNEDLKKIDISFWKKLQYLYLNIDKTTFEKKNYNNINISTASMLNLILDFYESIDDEYYKKALQIIQTPVSLINFDKNSKNSDKCFYCEYLNVPFVNVKSIEDEKYSVFVHELQHGINFLINGTNTFSLFGELSSIFFEILFTDILDSVSCCDGLYSSRINDNVIILEWLNEYVNILISFDENNRKVNKKNITNILNVKEKNDIEKKYNKFINKNFIEYCRYALSFLKSLELREKYYYFDKKEAIKELKDSVSGKNNTIDFVKLVVSYNNYIDEIRDKQKDYQKNVNL